MIKKLRAFVRSNPVISRTVYPVAWYFMNKVLHWRSLLLQIYGIDILVKVQAVATQENVQCSPYFGTLLGLVRDGRLIKNDVDIDFVVSPECKDIKRFYNHLKSIGFVPERVILLNNRMLEFTMSYKIISVDFFLVGDSTVNDKIIFVFDDRGEVRLHIYPKITEMEELKMASSVIVRVPKNAAEHLVNEYGNWRVPEKNWDARRGPSFRGLLDRSKCEFKCISDAMGIDLCFDRKLYRDRIDGVQIEQFLVSQ